MEFEEEKEKLIERLIASGALKTKRIIEAFRKVPRHLFVTEEYLKSAYLDVALPTIDDSTISQPTTVAIMTEALAPKKGEKILEVGTGSGWQACILAYCVGEKGKVITIDINPELVKFAKENIKKVGFKNIEVIMGDGSLGYEEEKPYSKIIITAACSSVPEPLIDQLKVGGKLVAPLGDLYSQKLIVLTKRSKGKTEIKELPGEFVFVPLKGKLGIVK
jgi:protein-L-isoaspartate(D-aspartate) O-methyltransferase